MNTIYALTDYKGYFGSKWKSNPYRSGFDQVKLKSEFNKLNYDVEFIRLQDVNFNDDWKNKLVVYTSSEGVGYNYKSYIEDVVLALERAGAILLPRYDYLRANNNKVYMEILREQLLGEELSGNSSKWYGTLEELLIDLDKSKIKFPCIIKKAEGAMSRGVFLCNTKKELIANANKISRSLNIKAEIKEIVRAKKHNGYKAESKYQHKFIVQKFISDLQNDWKILVFGNHYYVLNRGIKDGDFRASGSGHNYKAGSKSGLSFELLDKVRQIYQLLDVPHLSLDLAVKDGRAIIHEFQALYFGTATMDYSDDFFVYENSEWKIEKAEKSQEEEYAYGLVHYLDNCSKLII